MDRGKGFDEEDIPVIFNKFYRGKNAKAGGTGLGLSIVKGFVEAHGGSIDIESEVDKGTKVTVRLPSFLANCPLPTAN